MQKKREKLLKMGGGVSKVKQNIKLIPEFKPEAKAIERNYKRVKIKIFFIIKFLKNLYIFIK